MNGLKKVGFGNNQKSKDLIAHKKSPLMSIKGLFG